jgi:Cytochrome c554 and c-prime
MTTSAWLLLSVAGLVLVAASAAAGGEPPTAMPGPAPHADADARAAANAACEKCHADEADEWRGSLHQQAFDDRSFQVALREEPLPFCRGCHAPEADPTRAPGAAARDTGVGCVSCHLVDGSILAAPAPRGARIAPSPHAVVRDARFTSDAACAGCHEFDFPGARHGNGPPMQLTVSEHARSAAKERACSSCHMPAISGSDGRRHHAHDFAASRSEEKIRAAARVQATRASARTVRVTIDPSGVGHAFPTGDLFRRLELRATVDGDERDLPTRSVYLARRFETEQRGTTMVVRIPAGDDRVGAHGSAPSVVDVDLGPRAEGRAIVWRLVYQRVAHLNGDDPRTATIDGEIQIASGVVGP